MILPDVNVLVYAFRREAPEHELYAAWLSNVVAGSAELALHDVPLAGFVRIVTNPRILSRPAPTEAALSFVERLIAAPRSRWLSSGAVAWEHLADLVRGDSAIRGNLLPDAHLAAVALAHGCRFATADRGFARFPGLDWFDPIR
ncbi:MAG: PIN domain-containing protein [Geodermatophilaceae bacterium]|nr:PIN domain-containing protein [Geodermatophilaceae bacterium]